MIAQVGLSRKGVIPGKPVGSVHFADSFRTWPENPPSDLPSSISKELGNEQSTRKAIPQSAIGARVMQQGTTRLQRSVSVSLGRLLLRLKLVRLRRVRPVSSKVPKEIDKVRCNRAIEALMEAKSYTDMKQANELAAVFHQCRLDYATLRPSTERTR
nr:hypothetical protein CFP56_21223 [Quercus suber]